jgi:tetratricopeptide (TPR) repeat protein
MKRTSLWTLVSCTAAALPLAAQDHAHAPGELGDVEFPVSCNAEAQQHMHRAVAMLHSFWYPEARREFETVAQADPGCGIAYWGVALSYFGNPMAGGSGPDQQPLGLQAAERAASMGARTARDRGYIDAALALFRDHQRLDNRARSRAHEEALAAVVRANPQDQEAKIFHAIFMVANASPSDLTFARQKEAAAILIPMFERQPQHPGLAHYIIHAFDSPPLANQALSAARRYADIAPAAPHAVHMPSHIFTRLGYWDESIRTNRRSADLEPAVGGKVHPMDYMVYAYLQKGQDDAALAVIREVGGDASGRYGAGNLTSYNAAAMPARYALERNDWRSASALAVLGGPPNAEAVTRFARGLGAARSGNVAAANTELQAIQSLVERLNTQDPYWAHVVDAQRLAVSAWVAQAEGKREEALRLARAGADKEDEVEKAPVTPGPLIPSRELLGDLLLAHGQHAEALAAYQSALQREPNRARTLNGAAAAARALGQTEVARRYYRELVSLMDPASSRPELAEAKAFLGSF